MLIKLHLKARMEFRKILSKQVANTSCLLLWKIFSSFCVRVDTNYLSAQVVEEIATGRRVVCTRSIVFCFFPISFPHWQPHPHQGMLENEIFSEINCVAYVCSHLNSYSKWEIHVLRREGKKHHAFIHKQLSQCRWCSLSFLENVGRVPNGKKTHSTLFSLLMWPLSNAWDKSGSALDFALAGFQKRGFSTNGTDFHLIEINWCSSRVALFNIIE